MGCHAFLQGIFLTQESNPRPLNWQAGPLPLMLPGEPMGAAAAAKSLQSCPTLCDPIDSSPPGSSVPGILQARILEWVAISFSNVCMHAKLLQSCLTLYDPMDCSAPGSSIHGILQARILEWVAISFSRGSSVEKHEDRDLTLASAPGTPLVT